MFIWSLPNTKYMAIAVVHDIIMTLKAINDFKLPKNYTQGVSNNLG